MTATLTDAPPPADTAATGPLPAPWAMSLRALDSWHTFYRDRTSLDLAPLSNAERRHRAEVEQNIFRCHEARRHSCFPR